LHTAAPRGLLPEISVRINDLIKAGTNAFPFAESGLTNLCRRQATAKDV
jgi:hypothetical protein